MELKTIETVIGSSFSSVCEKKVKIKRGFFNALEKV